MKVGDSMERPMPSLLEAAEWVMDTLNKGARPKKSPLAPLCALRSTLNAGAQQTCPTAR